MKEQHFNNVASNHHSSGGSLLDHNMRQEYRQQRPATLPASTPERSL